MVVPNKILFIRTDRLGDFLLNLPAIHQLKKTYPAAHISCVIHPDNMDIVSDHPDIDELISFSSPASFWRWTHFFWRLRKQKYDMAIISNPHKYFHLFTFLIRIPIRAGYKRKWGFFLTHSIADKKHESLKHEVEYNLDLINEHLVQRPLWNTSFRHGVTRLQRRVRLVLGRFGGCAAPSQNDLRNGLKGYVPKGASNASNYYEIFIPQKAKDSLQNILVKKGINEEKPIIVINPYTTASHKQWPIVNFIFLINKLYSYSIQIILMGGKIESLKIKEEMIPFVKEKVFDLSGLLILSECAALLQKASLLISNDSGPVHIASALKTPMIILFGNRYGSNPIRWGPWNKEYSTIIENENIEDIKVEEIWKHVQSQLHISLS